ncbi:MAG: hypothetical protein E3K38_04715 [Candidatus Kuenenia stuttgartiensis]|nr:hypothetical protein [Candidatus Kuenenia stuttgartiensis]
MLRINIANMNPLKLLFIGIISCFFGVMILQYNYKAIAFLIFLGFVLVFFIRVEYVFYFLLASRSLVDILYDVEAAGGVRVTHAIATLVIVLFSLYFFVTSYNIFRSGVNKAYLTFMSLAIMPLFFSKNFVSGFENWLKLLQTILILNMTILIVIKEDGKSYKERMLIICWAMIIALVIPYILFLKNYIQGSQIEMSGYIRYADFGSYTNLFSYYLFSTFPVCLFLYSISSKRPEKIFWLVFMVILILTIYKTYTRNVWIGITIMIFTWNLLRKNYKVVFIVLILIVTMLMLKPDVQDRFSDIFSILNSKSLSNVDPKLLSSRIAIWYSNIDYFLHTSTFLEQIFGSGFDVKERIAIFLNSNIDNPIEEHSNYLTLLMNTGICGLFLYHLFIFMLFLESFKLLRRTKDIYFKNLAQVFISLLFAYVIISIFTHMVWKVNYQYYFSSIAGLIVGANILEEKRREKTSSSL